jgi:hypothetical protein
MDGSSGIKSSDGIVPLGTPLHEDWIERPLSGLADAQASPKLL